MPTDDSDDSKPNTTLVIVQTPELRLDGDRPVNRRTVRSIVWNGVPVWLASDIALVLGYERAHDLAEKIRGDWAGDFTVGVDCLPCEGEELRPFKEAGLVAKRASAQLVLTESGVNLAAIMSRAPASRALRRWLASEVMPAIRRTGGFSTGEVHEPRNVDPAAEPITDLRAAVRAGNALRLAGDKLGCIALVRRAAGLPPLDAPATPKPHVQLALVPQPASRPPPEYSIHGVGALVDKCPSLRAKVVGRVTVAKVQAALTEAGLWTPEWMFEGRAEGVGANGRGWSGPDFYFRHDLPAAYAAKTGGGAA